MISKQSYNIPAPIIKNQPLSLDICFIKRPEVIHSAFTDNTDVHIAAWSKIIEDTCCNSIPNQVFALFLL